MLDMIVKFSKPIKLIRRKMVYNKIASLDAHHVVSQRAATVEILTSILEICIHSLLAVRVVGDVFGPFADFGGGWWQKIRSVPRGAR